ncbi:MAG: hypothetical protein Q4C91_14675 [Eubacteriales bacterium]|nr:hypothetical protein [Eubacteriales bacterium]
MSQYVYKIIMYVPIGERKGMMVVNTVGDRIEGRMDILGHSEPFSGIIDEEGNCCIKGQLNTLMKKITFIAQGIILEDRLHLLIHRKKDVFEIFGDACHDDGKEQ